MTDELVRALRAQRRARTRARLRRITSIADSEADALLVEALCDRTSRLAPEEHRRPEEDLPCAAANPAPGKSSRSSEAATGPAPGASSRLMLSATRRGGKIWADQALLAIEVLGAIGLIAIMVLSLGMLSDVVQEDAQTTPSESASSEALATPIHNTPTAVVVTATPGLPPAGSLPAAQQTPTAGATAAPAATPGPTPNSPTGVRIIIPTIGVDAPMVEGDNWETLKTGIGHRPGSAWPGQAGNAVLSAHNDVYGSIFRELPSLQPGALVYVHTPTGVFRYEVAGSRVVLPSDTSVTKPTDEPTLTLITCYPPFIDTHRFIVTARLVE